MKLPKFIGVWDLHKKVMIVRTTVEAVLLLILSVLPKFFDWFRNIPNVIELTWCVRIVLVFSILSLIWTIYKESKNQSIEIITYFEAIVDAVMTIPLLYFLGGINGPLFFFYALMIMEGAATFNGFVIFFVTIIGVIAVIIDVVIGAIQRTMIFSPVTLILLMFRLAFLGLIGLYGHSLSESILKERKTRKNLAKTYRELKVLDKAKSEFISIASHQLRTPLSSLKGYLSLIKEKVYGEPPKKMRKPLENLSSSIERLIKLVNDLLNISQIEAGKVKLKPGPLSLEIVINSVVSELRSLAKEDNLYLKWKKPEESMPKIMADKDKIREVILNLIDNAIKYTERGGVMIEYKKIGEERCRITVSDTGEGMTEEEISNLFKSFQRGKAGQRIWTEGTGLGLYIAKKFVDMHKGKIWAESPGQGKGSTFFIELPIIK